MDEKDKKEVIPQSDYLILSHAIKLIKLLPTAKSHKLYKNHEGISLKLDEIGKNITSLTSQIVKAQNLKWNSTDQHGSLINYNDRSIDHIRNTLMVSNNSRQQYWHGNHSIHHQPDPSLVQPSIGNELSLLGTGLEQPLESQQLPPIPATFGKKQQLANSIPKPQDRFINKVDNSIDRLWTPKITYKPNSETPISLTMVEEKDIIAGYENVYKNEILNFQPEDDILEADKKKITFTELDVNACKFIDDPVELKHLSDHLNKVKEIAIDVEHHSFRSYMGLTCLVQISTLEGGDFILDALALRDDMFILNESFTNPKIIKILHGAKNDVLWLQRDLGLYLVAMFDTHKAAIMLRYPVASLSYLVGRHCKIVLNKSACTDDWRIRPLNLRMFKYAQSDTHYLIYIFHQLKSEILERFGKNGLLNVFRMSAKVASRPYFKPNYDESKAPVMPRDRTGDQTVAAKSLHFWRDMCARKFDESTQYIMGDQTLFYLAKFLPTTVNEIKRFFNPLTPFIETKLEEIKTIILNSVNRPHVHNGLPYVIIHCIKHSLWESCHDEDHIVFLEEDLPMALVLLHNNATLYLLKIGMHPCIQLPFSSPHDRYNVFIIMNNSIKFGTIVQEENTSNSEEQAQGSQWRFEPIIFNPYRKQHYPRINYSNSARKPSRQNRDNRDANQPGCSGVAHHFKSKIYKRK